MAPPLRLINGAVSLTDATHSEGNLTNVNAIIGYNDLFLKGNSAETSPVYLAGNEIKMYTSGTQRMKIDSSGNITISGDLNVSKGIILGGVKKTTWPSGGGSIFDSIVFNPQTTPPSSPVRGQVYFDANSNLMKYYDGAAWQFMDRGYLSGLIGYSGVTHTRQHCVNAGGMITGISGDGTNTEVCKFSRSSCPSGWARAGNWNTHASSINPDCNTGGDYCGNNKTTCCTVNACNWSNNDPKCTYYSYSKSSGGWGDRVGYCSFGRTGGCDPNRWCGCYYRPPREIYCDTFDTHTKSYSAFGSTAITEIGCK